MRPEFKIVNGSEIQMKFDKLPNAIFKNMIDTLADIGNDIRNTVVKSMQTTTINNAISYGRRNHHPSAYGNPPAIDRKDLINSIAMDVRRADAEVEVGSETGAPYAIYLENADDKADPHKRERKFLKPAMESQAGGAEAKLIKAIQKATAVL